MLKVLHGRRNKDDKTFWTTVGVAFPAKTGEGYDLVINYLPVGDGGEVRLLLRPQDKDRQSASPPRRDGDYDPPDQYNREPGPQDAPPPFDDEIGF